MGKRKTPIITHTEILSRAIWSIEQEIEKWRSRCDCLPDGERIFATVTEELQAKLAAVKELYRIEIGIDYE